MKKMNKTELEDVIERIAGKHIEDVLDIEDDAEDPRKSLFESVAPECIARYETFHRIYLEIGNEDIFINRVKGEIEKLEGRIEFHKKRYDDSIPEFGKHLKRVYYKDENDKIYNSEWEEIESDSTEFRYVRFHSNVIIDFLREVFMLEEVDVTTWVLYYYYLSMSGEYSMDKKELAYKELANERGGAPSYWKKMYNQFMNPSNRIDASNKTRMKKAREMASRNGYDKAVQLIDKELLELNT